MLIKLLLHIFSWIIITIFLVFSFLVVVICVPLFIVLALFAKVIYYLLNKDKDFYE